MILLQQGHRADIVIPSVRRALPKATPLNVIGATGIPRTSTDLCSGQRRKRVRRIPRMLGGDEQRHRDRSASPQPGACWVRSFGKGRAFACGMRASGPSPLPAPCTGSSRRGPVCAEPLQRNAAQAFIACRALRSSSHCLLHSGARRGTRRRSFQN
jgi:hypothetical protein